MKQIYNFILLLLLVLGSCSNPRYGNILSDIDSLSNDNPKQALEKLDSLYSVMDTTNVSDLMYYKLVKLKAQDKSYIPHPSIDNLNVLIKYYEGDGDKHLLPQVYYLAGTTYDELHDSPAALDYYHKALEILDKEDNLRLRCLVNAQIGYILYFQDNYKQAKKHFQESYRIDSLRHDVKGMIYDLRDIGLMNLDLSRVDDALTCYKEALHLARQYRYSELQTTIFASLASLYLEKKPQNVDSVSKYCLPLLNSVRSENQSGVYSIAAQYYRLLGKNDSVNYYLGLIDHCGSIYAKKYAQKERLNIMLSTKKHSEELKVWRLYLLYCDSVNEVTSSEAIAKSQSLYDYSLRVKENYALKEENYHRKIVAIIAIGIIVVLVLILYLYHVKSDYIQKEQTRQLEELHRVLEAMKSKNINQEEPLDKIKETSIYGIFVKKLESHINLTDDDWHQMDDAIDTCFKDFKITLARIYTLKEHEYHICILVKLHFSVTAMSILLHREPSSITMARKRLCKKFFKTEENASKFDRFIESL